MTGARRDFRGNKQALPRKICATCARPMVWRKAWAKNWDSVKYCSDRCRGAMPKAGHRKIDP